MLMKPLFAACNLTFGPLKAGGPLVEVPRNFRIPEELLTPELRKSLLAKEQAVEVEPIVVPKTPPATQQPEKKLWAFDLEKLEGKSLDELNMMIQSTVKQAKIAPVEPFKARDEALAFMTSEAE